MRRIAIIAALALLLVGRSRAAAERPDREEIRASVRAWWDSIDTLEVTFEEYVVDEEGEFDLGMAKQRYEMTFAGRDRYIIDQTQVGPDGTEYPARVVRQDHQRHYHITPFSGHPGSISRVIIKPAQGSRDDIAVEGLNTFLWSLMPGGMPVHAYLDDAVLDTEVRDGVTLVSVETHWEGKDLRLFLDPKHDLLARRVVLEVERPLGPMTWEVVEFGRKAGRWLPMRGISYGKRPINGGKNTGMDRRGFIVKRFEINQPVPDTAFSLPAIPDGALVYDEINGTRTIKGGSPAAREQLLSRYPPRPDPVTAKRLREARAEKRREVNAGDPIVASTDPPRDPWWAIPALGSAAVLGAAVWFRHQRTS